VSSRAATSDKASLRSRLAAVAKLHTADGRSWRPAPPEAAASSQAILSGRHRATGQLLR
jgi:hypothetical protein